MDEIPGDIVRRIHAEFPKEEESAIDLLRSYQGSESSRVWRCILHLSRGSIDLFLAQLKTAQEDYRDVIYFAEYDQHDRRIHDFSRGFRDYE